ncbi:MAG: hypothetical protein IK123_08290 [Lachnospiraceae bacterium]|nr:hypothetical protein [Lachnospiraceae bacterium]
MLYEIPSALEKYANAHADTFIGLELKYVLENGTVSDRFYLISMGIFVFIIICAVNYRHAKHHENKKEGIDEAE